MKYWVKNWFTSGLRLSPPIDQTLLDKKPIVQCSGWTSRTI
jgi:hypothetical protein